MSKKNTIILTITVLFFGLLVATGTFAFWSWRSNNTNITFNTANELKDYIEYDEGESQFAGSLQASDSYLTGSIHSTITINKKAEAANVDLVASIMMDINAIGNNMKTSSALKWIVTNGNATNPGSVLAKGNFIGTNAGDTLTLVPSLEVTQSPKQYTIWIWLDQAEHPSELLSGETLDTNVWTQIDQVESIKETFEVTRISANNQNISATAVNSKNNITNYALTQSTGTPSSWQNIAQADQAKVYNLTASVNATGTWYVWFKDSTGKTTSREVTVTTIDSTPPTCTFGSWSKTLIKNGDTSTIDLTCTDAESPIAQSKLEVTDLTKSNNAINITSINKTSVTNGYKYTITVTGTETNTPINDTTTISIPANKIKNSQNLGNAIATSGSITNANVYSVILDNQGANTAGTTQIWYQYNQSKVIGSTTCYYYTNEELTSCLPNGYTITKPQKTGYTFKGYYSQTNGGGTQYVNTNNNFVNNIYKKTPSEINSSYTDTITLYAYWTKTNYTITIKAGNGVSSVSGTGWTNTETATMTKSVAYGTVLNLCETTASATNIVATRKNGYTGCSATKTTGSGTLNANTFTVGAGTATLTLAATGIETPVPTISIASSNKIYGLSQTNLSASVTNTYDSGITVNYTYYYDTAENGNYENTQTNPISATSHKGTRYYKVKATATDNTLTSTATSSNNVSLTLIRTSYTPDANNCGTLSSSSALFAYKGENQLYNDNTGGQTASWPTLTVKTGYTLDGWYTTGTNGSKVLNADGTIASTDVSGYTLSNNFDSTTNRTLYAQCSVNTYTISYTLNGGTASNPTSATYDTNVEIANPTRDGYLFLGWTSTTLGTNAKTGTTTNPTTSWNGSLTKNTYFKNLIESGTVTLVANWLKQNYLNIDTNTYYETLQDAFGAVQNNQTIRVVATTVNESSNTAPTLASSKTGIKLDLYGHTISLGSNTLTNNGGLDIYSSVDGGILEGSYTYVIYNNGTLTTSNTASNILTIQNTLPASDISAYVISNNQGKTITLKTGTTITIANEQTVNATRHIVFNYGILNINGATLRNNPSSTNVYNAGIRNYSSGKINMTSGTINVSGYGISNAGTAADSIIISGGTLTATQYDGIYNSASGTVTVTGGEITGKTVGIYNYTTGTITLGDNSNAVNGNSPIITSTGTSGNYYSINIYNNGGILNFYDGKIVSHSGTNHTISGTVSDTPTGYRVIKTIENNVETATLSNTYTIKYYKGNASATAGNTKIATEKTCTYGESCTLDTISALGYTFPRSSNLWAFAGWSTTETGTTVAYTDGQTFTYNLTSDLNLYSVGKRGFSFSSGVAPTTHSEKTYQYWNPYDNTATYVTTVAVPNATAITGWTFYGYRATNDATSTRTISSTYAGKSTYKPAPTSLTSLDFRSIYQRTLTLAYDANTGTGTTENQTGTQYYNSGWGNGSSNSGANVSTVSFTLKDANAFTKAGYTLSKWAAASTSGTQYNPGASYTAFKPAVGNTTTTQTMYAIWTPNNYTISYTLDGGSASNPTTAAYDSDVQIAAPTKEGYMFTGWTSTTLGANAKTGTTANPTTSWDGSLTTNTYFKNLIDSGTVTLVANWLELVYFNVDTETNYTTLSSALSAVQNNQTIRVYKNTDESANTEPTLASTKTGIKLDLYGHTVSLGTKTLTNNGGLDINSSVNGGILQGSGNQVVCNNGTLTTSNAASNTLTIRNTIESSNNEVYVILNNENHTVTIKSGTTVSFTNTLSLDIQSPVIGNYGSLNINGATLSNSIYGIINTGIINMTSGTINASGVGIYNESTVTNSVTISGGTITVPGVEVEGTVVGYGIYNESTLTIVGGTINSAAIGIINGGTVTLGTNDSTINSNSPVITSTDTSGNNCSIENYGTFNFYDGKVISNAGTDTSINGTVSNTPTGYHVKKTTTNNVETAELDNHYTIQYNLNGGTASNPTSATYGEDVVIANPTKEGSTFLGWTSNYIGENAKTGTSANPTDTWDGSLTTNTYFKNLTEDETITLVANWVEHNYLNIDTNTYYGTLNDAFTAVANNQTIRVMKATVDEANAYILLDSTKTGIKLDLYGHTVSLSTSTLTNNGGLDIYSSVNGGILEGSGSQVVYNNGTLTTSNTASNTLTIRNTIAAYSTGAYVINNNTNKTVTLNSGTTLEFSTSCTSGVRYLVQNGGTLNVSGATLTNNPDATNSYNRGVNNNMFASKINMTSGNINTSGYSIYNNGTSSNSVIISGGSITSKKATGIYNYRTGTVTIGDNSNAVNINSPVITTEVTSGTNYGIQMNNSNGILNFYDGKVVSHRGTGYAISGEVSDTPVGYVVKKTTENNIETVQLVPGYKIEYSLNGGTSSNPSTAEQNSDVQLANPTLTNCTFTGWTSSNVGSNAKTGTSANPTTPWDGSLTTNTYFKDLVESGTAIMIANWSCAYENVDTTVNYPTLNAALAAVGNNETIRVNVSRTETANAALPSGVTGAKLDLNGKTITMGTYYITNNGELDIYSSVDGGILTGANTSSSNGVVLNNGTLTTSNTASNTLTIRNTAEASSYIARVIVNSSGKTATLKLGTTLEFSTTSNDPRYLVHNNGTLNVSGATLTNNPDATNIYNSGIYNVTSASKINMTSGTINVSGDGINNLGTAADSVTISGGSIASTNYNGIYNSSTGTVSVTGGSITSTKHIGINNNSTGTVSVTGGSVTSTNSYGILNSSKGTVAVTGGTVTGKTSGIYNYSTGTITIGDNANAVNTNSPVITSTATTGNYNGINNSSGTLNFYDGKVVSHRGGTGYAISGTVSDIPTGYHVKSTLKNGIETATLSNIYNIDYYLNGGTASNPTSATYGEDVVIANPTKGETEFLGWTGSFIGENAKTGTSANPTDTWDGSLTTNTHFKNLTEDDYVRLVANWKNYLNVDTNTYYSTLNDAFTTVQNNQTIRVVAANINEANNPAPTLDNTKTGVKLDLYGHTVSLGTKYLNNNGELDIYSSVDGGILTSTNANSAQGTIVNNGTLTTSNTASNTLTIKGTYEGNTIYNSSNKTVTLNAGTTIDAYIGGSGVIAYTIPNKGILNINGATLTNSIANTNTLFGNIDNYGTVNLISGTINKCYWCINNNQSGTVNMSGGTITARGQGIRNTSSNGTVTITGGNITSSVSSAVTNSGTLTIGINDATVSQNNPVITTTSSEYGVTGTFSFYDGKIVSHAGTDHAIHGTVSDTPTGYMVVKSTTNGVETATLFRGYNIEYTLNGGSASNPTLAEYDSAILIANPTKEGYMFTGWTSTTLGANAKTGTTNNPTTTWTGTSTKNTYFKNLVDTGTVTMVANWTEANYQNVETGEGYATLNDAFTAVQNNQTIRVIAQTVDESANTAPSLASGKTGVKLDLYGHTISLGTKYIRNNGELDIYSSVNGAILEGTVVDAGTYGILRNYGTLTTSNTASNTLTIQNIAENNTTTIYGIYNSSNKTMTLNTGTTLMFPNVNAISKYHVINNGTVNINGAELIYDSNPTKTTYSGIYNQTNGKINLINGTINVPGNGIDNNGTAVDSVIISGGSITSTNNSGINNLSTGTVLVTGGTITGKRYGIYNSSTGIITIGDNANAVNTNSPVITSTSTSTSLYGIYMYNSSGVLNFYDGKVVSHRGTDHAIYGTVSDTPTGYMVVKSTTDNIETATLLRGYNIEYTLNGGTASNPTLATYDSAILIANPTKEGYVFTGWTSTTLGANAKTGTTNNPTTTWTGTSTKNTYFKNLVESGTVTLVANWEKLSYLNVNTNSYYATLNDAFAAVENNQTIRVVATNINETNNTAPTLASGKTGVKLDLYGNTVTLGTKTLTNNGGLDIYSSVDGGLLTGGNMATASGVVLNNGALTTSNTASNTLTIQNTADNGACPARVIVNNENKIVTLNNGTTINMTNSCTNNVGRYLVQNNGTVNINGATLSNYHSSSTTNYNRAILNNSTSSKINMMSGTINVSGTGIYNMSNTADAVVVTGGSITSANGSAIVNPANTTGGITIGDNSNAVNANSPIITSSATTGDYYGIYRGTTTSILNFYDGKIISHRGTNRAINGAVNETPVGYIVNKTLDGTVETMTLEASQTYYNYLNVDTNKYYVTLNDAFTAVENNQTIRVNNDNIDESANTEPSLASTKTGVKLDLYGHTVSLGTKTLTNNGGLDIYSSVNGGVLTGENTATANGVVKNAGTLTTSNTASNTLTIQNTAAASSYGARVIVNNTSKTATLNSGTTITMTIVATSGRYLVQNYGTLNVSGATLTNNPDATNNYNRGVNNSGTNSQMNMTSGTISTSGTCIDTASTASDAVVITGGAITSKFSSGIYINSTGTITLGSNDGTVSTTSPVITTSTSAKDDYGIALANGNAKLNYYDGKIVSNAATGKAINRVPYETATGYVVNKTIVDTTETLTLVQSNDYYNYLNVDTGKYYATLNDAFSTTTANQVIRVNATFVDESANATPTIPQYKTGVKLDVYGHTISLGTKRIYINSNAGLEIYSSVDGGLITGEIASDSLGYAGVIANSGSFKTNETAHNTLTIRNTASSTSVNARVIANGGTSVTLNEGTTLTMTTEATGNRYLITSYGGTINIAGATLTNNPTSTSVYNKGISLSNGKSKINMTSGVINTSGTSIDNYGTAADSVIISGGTITSTNASGIYNNSNVTGGITIGDNTNAVNTNSPVITSNSTVKTDYGVRVGNGTLNMYDGKIISSQGTGFSISGTVSNTPTGYRVISTIENGSEISTLRDLTEKIYIKKDGSTWNNSNMVVYLSTSATENNYNTDGGGQKQVTSGNVAQFDNLPSGTRYYVWASPGEYDTISSEYTGISFVAGGTSQTIDYYTFATRFNDNNISSITLDGRPYTETENNHIVLDNHTVDIEVTPNSNYYIYKYDLVDHELNTLNTIYGTPSKYKIEGTDTGMILYSRQQSGNYQNLATGTGYTTLSAALSAATSNQTIIANVSRTETANATLPSGVTNVKLDLNGKTINMGTFSIQNNGELDIYSSSGNGTISGTNTSNGIIYNNGDFTINNTNNQNSVTISNTSNSNSARAVVNNTSKNITLYQNVAVQFTSAGNSERPLITNNGTININGAVITGLTNDVAIKNTSTGAYINMNSGSINTGYVAILNSNGVGTSTPAVRINGGTVTGVDNAIVNNASGTVSIQGGNIVSTDGEYGTIRNNSSGRVEIINGTISSAPNGGGIFSDAGIINISGGTVNGGVSSFASSTLNITGGNINDGIYIQGTADITGGTITSDITSIYIYSGGTLNLGTTDTPVSQDSPLVTSSATSSTYYAIDNSGGTFNYYDGKLISNAGTNHTINGTVSDTPSGYTVKKTVNNGVETAILNSSYNIYIKIDDSTWNNSGVTVYLSKSAEENNYNTLGAGSKTVTTGNVATFDNLMSGTTYYIWATTGDPNIFSTSEYTGISFTPTANGNSIVNYYTLAVKAGDANVTGITAEGKSVSLSTNSWIETGFLDNHKINMSITTTTDYYVYKYDISDGVNIIDTIYQTPSELTMSGEGIGLILYSMAQSDNYQNINTGVSYSTLNEAFAAVNSNETIRVNTDISDSSSSNPTLANTKTGVKLDLNGKTITLGTKYIINNGELDVYSSIGGAILQHSNTNPFGVIQNNGTLTTNKTTKNDIIIRNTVPDRNWNAVVISNNSGKTMTLYEGTTLTFTSVNKTSTTKQGRPLIQNNGILNINGAALINNPNSQAIYNVGIYNSTTAKANVTSGTISTSGYSIYSVGTASDSVTINGGTITSTDYYCIGNNSSGTINITEGNITGKSAGIDNTSGTINITGGDINSEIIGINNTAGTINITGANIRGERGGIITSEGTVTLGTNNSTIITTPKIVADTNYGIDNNGGTFNFYDGMIVANAGANNAINSTATNTPTNYEVVKTMVGSKEVASLAPISRMRSASEIINGQSNGGSNTTFLNTNFLRGEIGTITFSKTTPSGITLINGTDISEHTDGSVMMYQVSNGAVGVKDYYIIQSGGVHFPVDSSYLFYHLPNLDNFFVNTADSLASINYVTNTSYMFAGDSSLTTYSLYGPGMSLDSVIDMTGMFMDNANIENIDIGHELMPMTTENLESMNSIFALNNKLNTVSLRMSTSKDSLTNLIAMFDNTTNIQNIYGIENIKYNANVNLGNMLHNANNLSTNTINNVLYMLESNYDYVGTKTLRNIGINQTTANNIVAYNGIWPYLSVNGWTTGY